MSANGERAHLGSMPFGTSAVIVGYTEGRDRRRFVEMGLVPGVHVTAIRSAPLGDPIEYAVMGSRVAIRRGDAACVLVEAVGP